MAKKKFKPKKPPVSEPQLYAAFIGDTLAGTIKPKKLEDARNVYGILAFDYEEAEIPPSLTVYMWTRTA